MEYIYFLETISNTNIDYNDIESDIIYILCYHINTSGKYPFLQFVMEKIPFCNNIVKEEFVLPHIVLNNKESIKELALNKVKKALQNMGYDTNNVTEEMYKGILWINEFTIPYILVNISDINLYGMYLCRNSCYWFILPTEIINTKEVCGINISIDVLDLFLRNPDISVLTNVKKGFKYILPDVVYTVGIFKDVEFNAIVGNRRSKCYESCGEYYYFNRSYIDAIKKANDINDKNKRMGLNRYALFVEGELYMETEDNFSLTDEIIEKKYNEPCVIICYMGNEMCKQDMLVKEDDSFVSLSYHDI